MANVLLISTDTVGKILGTVNVDEQFIDKYPGYIRLDDGIVVNLQTHFWSNNSLTDRPDFSLALSSNSIPADGTTLLTITGGPNKSCTMILSGPVSDTWNDIGSSFQLSVNMTGVYTLTVECWPYLPQTVTFDGT